MSQQERGAPAIAGRWAILASNGRHIWLGTAAPAEGALIKATEALHREKLHGWLVCIAGDYRSPGALRFSGWRRLTSARAKPAAALAAFEAKRRQGEGVAS